MKYSQFPLFVVFHYEASTETSDNISHWKVKKKVQTIWDPYKIRIPYCFNVVRYKLRFPHQRGFVMNLQTLPEDSFNLIKYLQGFRLISTIIQ